MLAELPFLFLLFTVAILYASVGHGGASSYLALMVLFGISPLVMKPTALLLNVFVSAVSFAMFYRAGYFNRRLLLHLVVASVPMSFIGGLFTLQAHVYHLILAIFLLLVPLRMIVIGSGKSDTQVEAPSYLLWLTGGAIGLVSGLIGIGGGIILSPILILMKWANPKQTAGISALFILLNSLAGLSAIFSKGYSFTHTTVLWVAVAVSGGLIGAQMGSRRFSAVGIKYILAGIMLFAGAKILIAG